MLDTQTIERNKKSFQLSTAEINLQKKTLIKVVFLFVSIT